ncbi:MAG: exosortase system-associated protein, TIGR04073 family [Methylococcaceae bacterium]|nr:MAG: exosortase system-associated protein, TIGR04073 family [Methylococcaceae bacterium]
MKTLQKVLMAATIAAAVSTPAHASYPGDVAEKVVRGFTNATLGWAELGKNICNEATANGPLYIPIGFMKGAAHGAGRSVIGIIDLSTALIPSESMVHPAHVWEDMSTETSYGAQ